MVAIRPYTFKGLKRLSQAQAAVHQSFVQYVSHKPFAPDFSAGLAALLERILDTQCEFGETEICSMSGEETCSLIPKTTCLVVVGGAPGEHKIVVEIDLALAHFAIDRVLGGKGDAAPMGQKLSEVETGVFSYLVLKLLSYFQTGLATGKELALVLDQFGSCVDDLSHLLHSDASFHMVAFRLQLGKRLGYARLFLPDALVTSHFAGPTPEDVTNTQELMHTRTLLKCLKDLETCASVEIATLCLSDEEIEQLGEGDIVLLDNHEIQMGEDGFHGFAQMKIGTGLHGGLRGRVFEKGESMRFEVCDFVIQQPPLEADAMATNAKQPPEKPVEEPAEEQESQTLAEAEDNLAQTQGLLKDVSAPVAIELGRLPLNTMQVARLRKGQILRLPRGPQDPVDLVVNGQVFARGELIDVDGDLGVRILKLSGLR